MSDRQCWACSSPCKRVRLERSWDGKRILSVVFECLTCKFDFEPFFKEDGPVRTGKRRFSIPFNECR